MQSYKVDKDNSADLGFVYSCRLSGAISREEFKMWVYWVIEHSKEELPPFFFFLDEVTFFSNEFYETVGFIPETDLNEDEESAIDGIAYLRGGHDEKKYDPRIERDEAITALNKNPVIETRFREMFPFIEW